MRVSPITGKSNCSLISTETIASLNEGYKRRLDIDVSEIFEGINTYEICKCNDTGLKFYNLGREVDNELFYGELSKFSWYYSDERWDFEETLKLVKPQMSVLEIGCGKGVFLKKINNITTDILGLELNQDAVDVALADGLPVKKLLIQEMGDEYNNSFDLVCTFQVVEHLMNLKDFLIHALRVLKPNGLLVITVPNNKSVMFSTEAIEQNEEQRFLFNLMNKPPHHFLLWNSKSLTNLAAYFPLKVRDIRFEELPHYLVNFAVEVWYFRLKKWIPKRFIQPLIKKVFPKLQGHSVMAVYTKVA